jgi:hypothetical protein
MIGNAIAGFLGTGVAASTTAYESIATTTVGSGGSSSVNFSSIPSTYTHLQIRIMARDNRAGNLHSNINMTFNSDTAANYAQHSLLGNGSTASAAGYANQTEAFAIRCTGASAPASTFGVGVIDILDYANTNKFKTVRSLNGNDQNGAGELYLYSDLWRSTSAITSIVLNPVTTPIQQYSSFALYGIKG